MGARVLGWLRMTMVATMERMMREWIS